MKVIYLHRPEGARIWADAIFDLVGAKHDLTEWDRAAPLEPQFADVAAMLDLGGRAATREMLAAARSLRLWQIVGVGVDAVDLSIADGSGAAIASCPGSTSAQGLAEAAMMFMLMLARRYRRAQRCLASGRLYSPPGEELEGKRLGIVGFGASGRRLATMAVAFGMRLLIVEPQPIEPALLEPLQPELVGPPDDLDRLMAEADFISLHLPLTAHTRELVDRRKAGFAVPISQWLRDGVLRSYTDMLVEPRTLERGLLQRTEVTRIVEEHRSRRHDHGEILWGLVNLELWHRVMIDGRGERPQGHIAVPAVAERRLVA